MTEKKGGCCSDEHQFYKIEDSHKNASNVAHYFNFFDYLPSNYTFEFSGLSFYPELLSIQRIAVPRISSPPIYILNCVFRL